MNIENEKLSGRQFGRMLFYDFFALTTLLLPRMLAQIAGMDGFFALAGGYVLGYVFLLFVLAQMRYMGSDYHANLSACFGKVLTALVVVVYLLVALFGAAYGLELLCHVTRQYLVRDTPVWLVLGVLVVLAIYGLGTGLESRGRMYEILFWFVMAPILFLMIMAAYNVEPERWVPVAQAGREQIVPCIYLVFSLLVCSSFFPILVEGVSDHADMEKGIKRSFLLGACINLVLYLLLTGIFGVPTLAVMDEAVLTLTAMVKVPGGFLERQDVLLCGIWFISMFAFVENTLYYSIWCIRKLTGKKMQGWYLFGAGIIVYVLAACIYRSQRLAYILAKCYMEIAVPVLVGIILAVGILSAWKNRNENDKNDV